MKTSNKIIEDIRKGVIDINNQELFFSTLIKGLILNLDGCINVRNIPVPHMSIHTGSDLMYLEKKGQDMSIEPFSVSNEDYIYQIVPRCIINLGAINLIPDQMTNPYTLGQLQYDSGEEILNLKGEFRRMSLKLSVDLKYVTDTYRDFLEIAQQIITKLSFIRTFDITYMGQLIQCSYSIPESFDGEHLMEMDGSTQDDKLHKLSLSLEVETNIPVYSQRTIMHADQYFVYGLDIETIYSAAIKIRNNEEDKISIRVMPLSSVKTDEKDYWDAEPEYALSFKEEALKMAESSLTNEQLEYLHKEHQKTHKITM